MDFEQEAREKLWKELGDVPGVEAAVAWITAAHNKAVQEARREARAGLIMEVGLDKLMDEGLKHITAELEQDK